MNWDRIEGEWKQRRGKAVHHWGKMMNDELAAIAGKYEELVGRLQSKYGVAREDAERQINEFKKMIAQLKESNIKLKESQHSLSKYKRPPGKGMKSVPPGQKRRRPKTPSTQ